MNSKANFAALPSIFSQRCEIMTIFFHQDSKIMPTLPGTEPLLLRLSMRAKWSTRPRWFASRRHRFSDRCFRSSPYSRTEIGLELKSKFLTLLGIFNPVAIDWFYFVLPTSTDWIFSKMTTNRLPLVIDWYCEGWVYCRARLRRN